MPTPHAHMGGEVKLARFSLRTFAISPVDLYEPLLKDLVAIGRLPCLTHTAGKSFTDGAYL